MKCAYCNCEAETSNWPVCSVCGGDLTILLIDKNKSITFSPLKPTVKTIFQKQPDDSPMVSKKPEINAPIPYRPEPIWTEEQIRNNGIKNFMLEVRGIQETREEILSILSGVPKVWYPDIYFAVFAKALHSYCSGKFGSLAVDVYFCLTGLDGKPSLTEGLTANGFEISKKQVNVYRAQIVNHFRGREGEKILIGIGRKITNEYLLHVGLDKKKLK